MPAEAPLAGKVALVTGAGVRVGRAIAEALGGAGADVAVHYRGSAEGARDLGSRLRSAGRRAVELQADLAEPPDCRRLVRDTIEGLGRLDLLVHSASNFLRVPLAETDESVWDAAMNVNARAALLLAREAAGELRARGGRVVLVSDFLALRPARNYVAHAVSKSAVEGLVRALAVEMAPEVIVNGVAPGTVLPPEGTTPEEAERLARRAPLKRNGSPEDVAGTVLFLCGGPSFMTGQVLRVDGGVTLT
jgi:pteridine reductase